MGAYLSEPITTKETSTEENDLMAVASCSMQGWRISQEDAHNAILQYDEDSSFFAVYDGHGGHEVAKYCAQKLPNFIKQHADYTEGKFDTALVESFIEFDRTLVNREVVKELKKIAGTDSEAEDHDPAEVDHLFEEATMPIEDVMAKYGKENGEGATNGVQKVKEGESSAPKTPVVNKALSGLSKTRKPFSPYLRGKSKEKTDSNGEKEEVKAETTDDVKDVETDDVKPEVKEVKTDDVKAETPVAETDDVIKTRETTGADSKTASDEKAPENGDKSGEDNSNGHTGEKAKNSAPVVNGEENCGTVKGKGKGKGKSSMSKLVRFQENEKPVEEPKPVVKKKQTKSAEELYMNMLVATSDDEDEDLDDDDDQSFGNKSESDDDEDDVEEDEEESSDDDEEEEEDSDEEDNEEEEAFGGNFNEEPGNDSGCTAVVALIRGNELIVANAGDSRCIVCRDGKAIDMSEDHKPEDSIETARIEKAGGTVTPDGRVNGGLNLSRAIGDHAYKTNKSLPLTEQMISPMPDIRRLTLDPSRDSFVFLACDGIWNSLTSQEVVTYINERIQKKSEETPLTAHLQSICEELFETCLSPDTLGDGTGCDNMTAVLVKLKPALGKSKRPAEAEDRPSKKAKLDLEGQTSKDSKETEVV